MGGDATWRVLTASLHLRISPSCRSMFPHSLQVYQLPMESSASFADLLEALEQQGSSLGLTHYAVSMPTLEEVFLAVTAEPAEHSEPPLGVQNTDSQVRDMSGLTSKALQGPRASSDGTCVIQMSAVDGSGAKQALSSGHDGGVQDGKLSFAHRSSTVAARHADAGTAAGSSPGQHGAQSSRIERGSRSEDGHDSSEGVAASSSSGHAQHDSRPGTALSISRDDSAQMLWSASEEAPHIPEQAMAQMLCKMPPGHEHQQSVPTSGSSMQQSVRVSRSEARPADDEGIMVDLPLEDAGSPRQIESLRWWIILREMLRKRALVAGKAVSLLHLMLSCLRLRTPTSSSCKGCLTAG